MAIRKIQGTRGVLFGAGSTGREPRRQQESPNPYRMAEHLSPPPSFGAQMTRFRLGQRFRPLRGKR